MKSITDWQQRIRDLGDSWERREVDRSKAALMARIIGLALKAEQLDILQVISERYSPTGYMAVGKLKRLLTRRHADAEKPSERAALAKLLNRAVELESAKRALSATRRAQRVQPC